MDSLSSTTAMLQPRGKAEALSACLKEGGGRGRQELAHGVPRNQEGQGGVIPCGGSAAYLVTTTAAQWIALSGAASQCRPLGARREEREKYDWFSVTMRLPWHRHFHTRGMDETRKGNGGGRWGDQGLEDNSSREWPKRREWPLASRFLPLLPPTLAPSPLSPPPSGHGCCSSHPQRVSTTRGRQRRTHLLFSPKR